MTRLHIHLSVDDLERSIIFHSALFGVEPMKQKPDYAKWMLDNPAVSFAISARGATPGLDHLGIQAESEFEMSVLRTRMEAAAMQTFDDGEATCCFAKADKTWVQDPSGIAWETYLTMEETEFFHGATANEDICCGTRPEASSGCCS